MNFRTFIHNLNGKLACMARVEMMAECESDPKKKVLLQSVQKVVDSMAAQIRDYYLSEECASILDFEDKQYGRIDNV